MKVFLIPNGASFIAIFFVKLLLGSENQWDETVIKFQYVYKNLKIIKSSVFLMIYIKIVPVTFGDFYP